MRAQRKVTDGKYTTRSGEHTDHVILKIDSLASYPGSRWAGKERAWYTLFAHAFNLPKIWGLRGIFWFFRVMWRQSSDSIMYTYQDITMACNESSDCSTATDLLNFVRSIITVSKLCLHFEHLRFSKPSSSFNVISNRALILDASLSWLAFFTKHCYSMVAISHRGSTKAAHRCHFR